MSGKKPFRRSHAWFGRQDRDGFVHRSWLKNQGYPHDLLDGRPVIGICNTWSELTPCNGHFRELAEFVKRGVYEAGGFPLEFPVMSLGETQLRPTAMLFRNLASMDVEESIRGNPIDGVVLLMGCDKTTPSLLMGAASCDLPTIGLSGGPMLNGKFRGQDLGSGTGVWKMSEMVRAGEMTHGRVHFGRKLHASLEGPLHDHGHRLHDGEHGRGARHGAARERRHTRGRHAPQPACAAHRPAHRRDGRAGPAHVAHPHARSLRECDPHQCRDRRLDQCGDPPAGHRRSHRRAALARRLRPARPRAALPGRPAALGPLPDGRLLLCRRPARGDARDLAPAAPAGADRQRPARWARTSPRRRAGTAR